MAATVTELRRLPSLRSIRSQGTIVVSGSYATGGDSAVFPKPGTTKPVGYVEIQSRNGNNVAYDMVNQKVKFFTAPGTELAAGAYPAAYTADTIDYNAEFPRGG